MTERSEVRSVRVGDVSLEIAEAGAGGHPLLMVHGFTGAKEDFTDWFDQLVERGWHVVAPDLRGHGASAHPPRPQDYSLALFEADVLALADDLGWDRFVLLGHSMGGMISQEIALHQPGRLDGLVLMDTVPDAPSFGGAKGRFALKVASRLLSLKMAARILRKPPPGSPDSVKRLYAERPGYGEWTRSKVLATSPVMAKAMMGELSGMTDRVPVLGSLDLPVHVIVGEHDIPGFVDGSQRMADAIPGATVTVIPGAGHNPQLETPDAWWASLTTFLDALPSAPSPAPETEGTT